MDDPILTTDDSRPLRVPGYAGLWVDALRSMIPAPVSTWVRGPLGRRSTVDDRAPASARVRGPLGRRPTVDDRAPREC